MMAKVVLALYLIALVCVSGQNEECVNCRDTNTCASSTNRIVLSSRPETASTVDITCGNGIVSFTFNGQPGTKVTKFETIDGKCKATGDKTTLSGDFHECLTGGFSKNDEETCFQAYNNISIIQRVPGSNGRDFVLEHNIGASCCMKAFVKPLAPMKNDPTVKNSTACDYFYFIVNPRDVGENTFGWDVKPHSSAFTNFYPVLPPHTNWYVDSCYAKGTGPQRAALVTDARLSQDFVYTLTETQALNTPYEGMCKQFFIDNPTETLCPIQSLSGVRSDLSDPKTDVYDFDMPAFAINGNQNRGLEIHCDVKICSTYPYDEQVVNDPNFSYDSAYAYQISNPTVFLSEYYGNTLPFQNTHCDWKFNSVTGQLSVR